MALLEQRTRHRPEEAPGPVVQCWGAQGWGFLVLLSAPLSQIPLPQNGVQGSVLPPCACSSCLAWPWVTSLQPSSDGNTLQNPLLKSLHQMDCVSLTYSWFQCANS